MHLYGLRRLSENREPTAASIPEQPPGNPWCIPDEVECDSNRGSLDKLHLFHRSYALTIRDLNH